LPFARHEAAGLPERNVALAAEITPRTGARALRRVLEIIRRAAHPYQRPDARGERHRQGDRRELHHAIERTTILADGERLALADVDLDLDLERIERMQQALAVHGGNISQAAAALGLTWPGLYLRIKKHGL
jgi:transcriptional regulator with GAF, ATPase, and Fis domain